jgi:hypothetical protein
LWQLLLAFAPLAIAAIAAVSIVSYQVASDSLRTQALRQLQTVRDSKIREVSRHFLTLEDQVVSLARNPSTGLALKQFSGATRDLDNDANTEGDRLRSHVDGVKQFLQQNYNADGSRTSAGIAALLPSQRSAIYLQSLYIANNARQRQGQLALQRLSRRLASRLQ